MSEIICHCFEVSREEIENAIREKGTGSTKIIFLYISIFS